MKGDLHRRDQDCVVDPETDLCGICHAIHGEPCLDCGCQAFHRAGCEAEHPMSNPLCLVYPFSPDEPTACGWRLDYEEPSVVELELAAAIAWKRVHRHVSAGKIERARRAAYAAAHLSHRAQARRER